MRRRLEANGEHTADDDREHREAFVATDEHIKDNTRAATDDHRDKQRGPTLEKQVFDVRIPSCDESPTYRRQSEKDHCDEGDGS